MAAGCGSLVIQGLLKGYNIYGVEPEKWKQRLIDLKFKENGYPQNWRTHIVEGVGENLPFPDGYFDVVNSWQTFEHVQNVGACLKEIYRTLKPGGTCVVHCPTYMTFYEGHYRMFWIPMLGDSWLGRCYVKLMGRPVAGLKTFHPIRKSILIRLAVKAGFKVIDLRRESFHKALGERFPRLIGCAGPLVAPVFYGIWLFKNAFIRFGRAEGLIYLMLIK
jgi:SAM-dependent methyltransferase